MKKEVEKYFDKVKKDKDSQVVRFKRYKEGLSKEKEYPYIAKVTSYGGISEENKYLWVVHYSKEDWNGFESQVSAQNELDRHMDIKKEMEVKKKSRRIVVWNDSEFKICDYHEEAMKWIQGLLESDRVNTSDPLSPRKAVDPSSIRLFVIGKIQAVKINFDLEDVELNKLSK